MKAVLLTEFGSSANFYDAHIDLPEPGPGEVRIRVMAAGFDPIDRRRRVGALGGNLPLVIGTECSGSVDAVGEGVEGLAVGDRVFSYLDGPRSNGCYAEALCVNEYFAAKIPEDLDWDAAAALPMVGLTMIDALEHKAHVRSGETVLLGGSAGGTSAMAYLWLKTHAPEKILVLAINKGARLFFENVVGTPPEDIIDVPGLSYEEVVHLVRVKTGGRGVTLSLDFVGSQMKKIALYSLDYDGRMVSTTDDFGMPITEIFSAREPLFRRSASITMSNIGARARRGGVEDWKWYRSSLEDLAARWEREDVPMVPFRVLGGLSRETVVEAHELMDRGRAYGKLIMHVGEAQ
ncbi:MAG: zinc-binding alcohol dehydrogenase family protein [Fimbriimonadaceae bacterium]